MALLWNTEELLDVNQSNMNEIRESLDIIVVLAMFRAKEMQGNILHSINMHNILNKENTKPIFLIAAHVTRN